MSIRRLSLLFLCLAAASVQADPAPWFWWISNFDGNRVCSQTSPGEGWTIEPIPFKDSRCRVRLYPR